MNLRNIERANEIREQAYSLKGKTIMLTGRITKYTRTTIENKIKELGGLIITTKYNPDILVYTNTESLKYRNAMIQKQWKSSMVFVKGEEFITKYLKLEG